MKTVNIKINGYDYAMKQGITILDASLETLKVPTGVSAAAHSHALLSEGRQGCG